MVGYELNKLVYKCRRIWYNSSMIKDDTYDKTKYHLECMLSKKGDKSAEELFQTFFNGVLSPEFEESYGVKIKYSKNYKGLISKLEGIRETLVYKDHK